MECVIEAFSAHPNTITAMSFERKVERTSEYHYLKIQLDFDDDDDPPEISAVQLKAFISNTAMKSMYGEVGKAVAFDILKYDDRTREAIIRVKTKEYKRLWVAMTLQSSYGNLPCAFRVHQVSSQLMGLASSSRLEDFNQFVVR